MRLVQIALVQVQAGLRPCFFLVRLGRRRGTPGVVGVSLQESVDLVQYLLE